MTHADSGRDGETGGAHRTRLRDAPRWALALVPMRLFVGVTYVYAGIDKLANAHFLASADPFSVGAQLAGYARTSPLAPLINAAMPIAVPIGLLIALAELAVGLGLLTGLAFRLAAAAGAALSLLFWLTASWSVTPYFFSPDLPYGFAFVTLALAGDGGLRLARARGRADVGVAAPSGVGEGIEGLAGSSVLGRRAVLNVALLGLLTLLAALVAAPLRLLGYGERASIGQTGTASPTKAPPTATPAPTAPPAATPSAVATAPAATAAPSAPGPTPTAAATETATAATPTADASAGPVVASVADFAAGNSLPFTVPNQVPFAMGPGGPGILVKLRDGSVVAYSAICTHGRCTVGFDQAAMVIACPCHLATYDPANSAAVLSGPAPLPLAAIPLAVDGGGQIHVTATA